MKKLNNEIAEKEARLQALEEENSKLHEELKLFEELDIQPNPQPISVSKSVSLVQDGGHLKPLKPPKV